MKKPVVALVGRPNVGKSTVFNRLVGKKISIIEDNPGITRDRIYGNVTFNDHTFHLIDTGGIDISDSAFNDEIKVQVQLAVNESDVIVFIVDGKEGLTLNDSVVRDMLIKSGKKIILAINKVDSKEFANHQYDFYELGFDEMINISGEQNIGIYDLLEKITSSLPVFIEEYKDSIKFSIIGRPNVGKSSLANAILNEDRLIVSSIAGTTRDAVDIPFKYYDKDLVIIDTAGMRKQGKIYENVERYSLLRSMKAIDRSDVCVLVINIEEGIIEHDMHIAGYAIDAGKPVIIAVNKYDTVTDKEDKIKQFTKEIRADFAFLSFSPIVFVSALTKKRIHTLIPEVIKAYENSRKEIKTSILNDIITEAYNLNMPPTYKGKRLKIYFTSQVSTCPPTFEFKVNNKGLVHFSYKRYLENKIRENFDFTGTPIVLKFKNKGEIDM